MLPCDGLYCRLGVREVVPYVRRTRLVLLAKRCLRAWGSRLVAEKRMKLLWWLVGELVERLVVRSRDYLAVCRIPQTSTSVLLV